MYPQQSRQPQYAESRRDSRNSLLKDISLVSGEVDRKILQVEAYYSEIIPKDIMQSWKTQCSQDIAQWKQSMLNASGSSIRDEMTRRWLSIDERRVNGLGPPRFAACPLEPPKSIEDLFNCMQKIQQLTLEDVEAAVILWGMGGTATTLPKFYLYSAIPPHRRLGPTDATQKDIQYSVNIYVKAYGMWPSEYPKGVTSTNPDSTSNSEPTKYTPFKNNEKGMASVWMEPELQPEENPILSRASTCTLKNELGLGSDEWR